MSDHPQNPSPPPTPGLYSLRFECIRATGRFPAALGLAAINHARGNNSLVEKLLSPQERSRANDFPTRARAESFLLGRLAGKAALLQLEPKAKTYSLTIESGVFGQPTLPSSCSGIGISLAHTAVWGAAVCFPAGHPMGVDIEEVAPEKLEPLEGQLSSRQLSLIPQIAASRISSLGVLWSAMEGLGKAMNCGLTVPLELLEVQRADKHPLFSCWEIHYTNFIQFKSLVWLLDNAQQLFCLTIPAKSQLQEFEKFDTFLRHALTASAS